MLNEKTQVAIIIPARMGSSRFPNKPMAEILGVPMVELVYRHALGSELASRIAVATCDEEIVDLIRSVGGNAIMTSSSHSRATDRTAEALRHLEDEIGERFDIVVMLQGDEPTVSPTQVDTVIKAFLSDDSIGVVNLWGPMSSESEFKDPNCIKVVADLNENALFFSRSPIPHGAAFTDLSIGKQVCAIGFRRDSLLGYLSMKPTDLEIAESIDMNRILQHGEKVKLVRTDQLTQPVDVPSDIERVEAILKDQSWHSELITN